MRAVSCSEHRSFLTLLVWFLFEFYNVSIAAVTSSTNLQFTNWVFDNLLRQCGHDYLYSVNHFYIHSFKLIEENSWNSYINAISTAQFRAMRTHDSFVDFSKANETSEYFFQIHSLFIGGILTLLASWYLLLLIVSICKILISIYIMRRCASIPSIVKKWILFCHSVQWWDSVMTIKEGKGMSKFCQLNLKLKDVHNLRLRLSLKVGLNHANVVSSLSSDTC